MVSQAGGAIDVEVARPQKGTKFLRCTIFGFFLLTCQTSDILIRGALSRCDPPHEHRSVLDACGGGADKYVAEDREQRAIKSCPDENNRSDTREMRFPSLKAATLCLD